MDQKQIDRINELARKARTPEGLTQWEQVEQAASSLHQAASTVLDALFGSGSGDASSAENDAA